MELEEILRAAERAKRLRPRVLVVSSCTGSKRDTRGRHLPAEQLYTGQQHKRLMRGVRAMREAHGPSSVDLRIVSAGFGLLRADEAIPTYDTTFSGMGTHQLHAHANRLGIPADLRQALREPYDLAIILLGEQYLKAAQLDAQTKLGGPTIALVGASSARKLPRLARLRPVVLGTQQTRDFACGLVGLKGEVAGRMLEALASDWSSHKRMVAQPSRQVLALKESRAVAAKADDAVAQTQKRQHPSARLAQGEFLHFVSGVKNPKEVELMLATSRPFGVTLGECGKPCMALVTSAYKGFSRHQGLPPLFIDTGAFGEVRGLAITHRDWVHKLDTVYQLASRAGPNATLLYAVAPDKVGDQAQTLARLRHYRPKVKQIQNTGAHVIVGLQPGALSLSQMHDEVDQILGGDWLPGIPMTNRSGMTQQIFEDYLREKKPARIHLLGAGPRSQRLKKWGYKALRELSPRTRVQMDTSPFGYTDVRAALTPQARGQILGGMAQSRRHGYTIKAPWRADPVDAWLHSLRPERFPATEVYASSVMLQDYTDLIGRVSDYTTPEERRQIGEDVGLDALDILLFTLRPEWFLSEYAPDGEEGRWGEDRVLEQAIERAYDAHMAREQAPYARILALEALLSDPDFSLQPRFRGPNDRS
jgi:hypothetical protein